ncbi:MAG: hypothetical protein JO223_14895 [Hyphomicrobiales bacterium]|nr:hypothetical protein [Hyphomicrobiales bacterium]
MDQAIWVRLNRKNTSEDEEDVDLEEIVKAHPSNKRNHRMRALAVGHMVKVRYVEQLPYTFDVEVTDITDSDEFKGRVRQIFAADEGEITGGDIVRWKEQEKVFKKTDILG